MSADSYEITRLNKVRVGNRADYERATVHAILDEGFLAHVGFIDQARPIVVPMVYGRDGDTVYLHGAKATRMLKRLAGGAPVSITVTLVDGIVVGRSAFHHSANYRSVVIHGTTRPVTDAAERERALKIVTDHLLAGRWDEVRPMSKKEDNATGVVAVDIEAASAKSRSGEPVDEESDYDLPIWGGVIPVATVLGAPVGDSRLLDGVEVPASVKRAVAGK